MPGAAIEERDPTFKQVLSSTTTDAKGYFTFQDAKIGSTYYLEAKAYGFNPTRITVKLRHFARAGIRIKLRIAT
ncbi:MAG: carboxypeptidase-like regulatory domain-containing protein [Terracidiphilus sp.]